jgi:SIR2-like domain
MNIPDYLLQQIRAGNAVLFLGAGATKGAVSPTEPKTPPDGPGLGKLLSARFLGGKEAEKSLAQIAEYCFAVSDLRTVQSYVAEIFDAFEPAGFHKLVADFNWAALATTNYDQVLQKAYAANQRRLQTPLPVLRSNDRIDHELRDGKKVQLLKLHGCITTVDDEALPLILTVDQYVAYRSGREKLFRRFEELAGERTVVFVGYRVEDPNIREILQVLEAPNVSRPTHYLVTPGAGDLDKRVWSRKKIETIDGTFQQFMEALDSRIPRALRSLRVNEFSHPLVTRFRTNAALSEVAKSFLENDVFFIHEGMSTEAADPKTFYKGSSYGWSAHRANLDGKRNVTASILDEAVMIDETDRPRLADLYLIKGYAGSGKTVVLKRVAMDAALIVEKVVLYVKADVRLNPDALMEIVSHVGERVFVFVDGAAKRAGEIEYVLKALRARRAPVTMFITERIAEWNTECQALDTYVDTEYDVRHLSKNEIDDLLEKLEASSALGVMEFMTPQDRVSRLMEYANRELLVALYEITSGKSFEDIILDEYRQIASDRARRIYLIVCALNRLGVPVRAGLVRRVTGISFDEFKAEFFKPLEQIVLTEEYRPAADMAYRSRHPSIAQIIFERALPHQLDRFDLYIDLLKEIDIGYAPDRTAYRELIRSKHLLELFSDPKLVERIFESGHEAGGEDGYFYQQRATFEMRRAGGNLRAAQEGLAKARQLLPNDRSITHSLAELELTRAESAKSEIERRHYVEQAKSHALRLTGSSASSAHGYSTLARIELQKLRSLLKEPGASDDELINATKNVQTPLQEGLQLFRTDPHLLQIEADFQLELRNEQKAEAALRRANATNKGNMHVALALSRLIEDKGKAGEAREVLKDALNLLKDQPKLNSAMGRLLERHFPAESLEAELHWKRSFTAGDTNFRSQFRYARSLYLNGKDDESSRVFQSLKTARVARDVKQQISGWVREGPQLREFKGSVAQVNDANAWLAPFGRSKQVYLHRSEVPESQWSSLRRGDLLYFALGFNYMGPAASVKALGS